MNNKNLNTMYGGDFNNIQKMLIEDISDTSDYNVSLLTKINEKSGGFPSLANLAKLGNQISSAINKGEKLANQASKVINKAEVAAAKTSSLVDKFTGNNCITTAQSMTPEELKSTIQQMQKILDEKLKK